MKSITSLADQQACIAALSEAFANNKSVLQLCGSSRRSPEKIRRLIEYSFAECLEFGKVLSDDSGHAYALVVFPDRQKFSVAAVSRMFRFLFRISGVRNILMVLTKEQHMKGVKKAFFGDAPQYYLWFIGAKSSDQGRGYGTALLRELMQDAEMLGRQLVLETSTQANLAFYWKAGLECYHIVETPFPLYCFRSQS